MSESEFEAGVWFAFDEILGWINTQETQMIDKKTLYKHVMELRPTALLRRREDMAHGY